MDRTSYPPTPFTSSPGAVFSAVFQRPLGLCLSSPIVSLLLKNIPCDITSCSSNTLTCPYKRACILPQGQFLKYTEITFLHRDVTQTQSQNGLKQNDIKYLSEVKSKKGSGSLSIPKPEPYPTQTCDAQIRGVRDPVPVPLNSIYTLVFFRNVLDL